MTPNVRILDGDCLAVMLTLDADSIDAVICDPPYGLKFMGKSWDHGVPGAPFWEAALRVAKPGAHLVTFGGTRTYHRLTVGIEDAGWEIRDCLSWLYGSGFPKSHDVSKAIDKAAGARRERHHGVRSRTVQSTYAPDAWTKANKDSVLDDQPLTEAAATWKGYGTALKPAWEPIILARKPLGQPVAANVLEHSTGGLNIDGCRIGSEERPLIAGPEKAGEDAGKFRSQGGFHVGVTNTGRWPANVVLDEQAAAILDKESGEITSNGGICNKSGVQGVAFGKYGASTTHGFGDTGGASRFFYTAKASRSEREAGLDDLPRQVTNTDTPPGTKGSNSPRAGAGRLGARRNHHPTVKPIDLMQWLCRLVTPKGGLILDPFCGSGSTGRAAVAEGFSFIGIELDPEYATIARARITEYAPLFGDVA